MYTDFISKGMLKMAGYQQTTIHSNQVLGLYKGKIMIRFVLLTALVLASVTTSEAKSYKKTPMCIETGDVLRPTCGYSKNFLEGVRSIKVTMHRVKKEKHSKHVVQPMSQQQVSWFQPVRDMYTGIGHAAYTIAERIVAHPSGCPARQFCGCGASIEVFGHPVRGLYLAANWYKFPRAQPAPNTVAVRPHHVFVLKQHVEGTKWVVYDANSGKHLTRVHERSIAGYTIVKPI
jgi:hypothetical protein